jgi:hypothetical protein
MSEKNTRPDMKAFVVTKSGEKSFWNEIGAAWKTKNGGYSIKLHAVPVNGEIVLLPPKEKEDKKD